MADGKWQMAVGEWQMAVDERRTTNRPFRRPMRKYAKVLMLR
jgi:hypothetical protein